MNKCFNHRIIHIRNKLLDSLRLYTVCSVISTLNIAISKIDQDISDLEYQIATIRNDAELKRLQEERNKLISQRNQLVQKQTMAHAEIYYIRDDLMNESKSRVFDLIDSPIYTVDQGDQNSLLFVGPFRDQNVRYSSSHSCHIEYRVESNLAHFSVIKDEDVITPRFVNWYREGSPEIISSHELLKNAEWAFSITRPEDAKTFYIQASWPHYRFVIPPPDEDFVCRTE